MPRRSGRSPGPVHDSREFAAGVYDESQNAKTTPAASDSVGHSAPHGPAPRNHLIIPNCCHSRATATNCRPVLCHSTHLAAESAVSPETPPESRVRACGNGTPQPAPVTPHTFILGARVMSKHFRTLRMEQMEAREMMAVTGVAGAIGQAATTGTYQQVEVA